VGGGKQEGGRRPGTQACGLIAGFAAAAGGLQARLADADRQAALRSLTEVELTAMGAELNSGEGGLCNTISARFAGVAGDLLVSSLDLQGVAISTGAACSSGTTAASTNLLAMGLSEARALETIRISLGPGTQEQDIKALLELLPAIVQRARRFS
jgi:cysteine desulfurase